MKKAVSLLLIACLLFGVMPLSGVVSAGTTALPDGAGFFLDLSDEAALDKVTIPDASSALVTKAYDSETKAMVIHPTNGGKGTSRIQITTENLGSVVAPEYPVLAMRVKLSDLFMDDKTAYLEASTDQMGSANYQGPLSYDSTTEWQTVYLDLSILSNAAWNNGKTYYKYFANPDSDSDPETVDTWDHFIFDFCAGSYSISKGCKFTVKWIGLFDSVEAAYDCAGVNFTENRVLTFDNTKATTAGTMGNYTIGTTSSTISYDETQNALKVVSGGSTTEMGITVAMHKNGVSATDYPIFAYKVKLGSASLASITNGTLGFTSRREWEQNQGVTSASGTSKFREVRYVNYAANTDWQLMCFDFANSSNGTEYWKDETYHNVWYQYNINFTRYGQTSTAGDTYYVEWAGFFSSREEAQAYYALSNHERPSVVGAQLRESDNSFRYVLKVDEDILDQTDYAVEYGTVMVNADKFAGSMLKMTEKTSGFGSANPTTIKCISSFAPANTAYEGYKVYTIALTNIDTEAKQTANVAVRAYVKLTDSSGNGWVFYSSDTETVYGAYATNYAAVNETAGELVKG